MLKSIMILKYLVVLFFSKLVKNVSLYVSLNTIGLNKRQKTINTYGNLILILAYL